jgi:anhydro-N-acetylmuramic acid kinase
MRVLGIMSGTSIDGVDYALCDISAKRIELLKLWSRAFPKSLKRRLHAAATNECSAHELAQLHHDLGRCYAKQAQALRASAQLVALHGQTVFHNPAPRNRATLQIGEPAYLAEKLRVPVVSNFRAADIAAGGHGAPLAPLFHVFAFGRPGQHVCVNNLGGISNVTSIDWRGKHPLITAFDTGPGNVLLDLAVRELTNGRATFDRNGRFAARGRANEELLARWLKHPFFAKKPPKSTGRELFGEPFWLAEHSHLRGLSIADILATLTQFTARTIGFSYQRHLSCPPTSVLLCGGGAKNPILIRAIGDEILKLKNGITSTSVEELGWPTSAIEPAAFALLAYCRWAGVSLDIPPWTGARSLTLGGQITLPPK